MAEIFGKLLLMLAICRISLIQAQCVDEKGNYVDWAVLYKLPRHAESENYVAKNFIEDGQGYAYITSNNPEAGWTLSEKSVKDFTSLPGRILSPIYSQKYKKDLFHMFYNDEHPDGNVSLTKVSH